MADVAQFVEEDDNEFSYSVRLSAHELLQNLGAEPGLADHTLPAIVTAVEKHLQASPLHDSACAWKVSSYMYSMF